MDLKVFKDSLAGNAPPVELSPALQALWYDAKGDWNMAHKRAQAGHDSDSARVHAYLHRKEGDLGNAGYWYKRVGQPMSSEPLPDEWETLVRAFLPS